MPELKRKQRKYYYSSSGRLRRTRYRQDESWPCFYFSIQYRKWNKRFDLYLDCSVISTNICHIFSFGRGNVRVLYVGLVTKSDKQNCKKQWLKRLERISSWFLQFLKSAKTVKPTTKNSRHCHAKVRQRNDAATLTLPLLLSVRQLAEAVHVHLFLLQFGKSDLDPARHPISGLAIDKMNVM